ncbi:dispanin subfamily A member 2b-like [Heteronotia binoei]|uniref:dispanin subfamily A member 2b-like n=1 Tax=Heteronotia binoei TaxID=13085 RepID=UPI00292EBF81|nr:dispanin subfamily A member 2b-like [Heteronotia binoei]
METPIGQQQYPPPPPYPQQWVVQGTVVVVEKPPRDYVLLSLFNTIFLNTFCFGFVALIYSIKARDCKVVRDLEGATRHGKTAKIINLVCIAVGIVVTITMIILSTTVAKNTLEKWNLMERSLNQLKSYHRHN